MKRALMLTVCSVMMWLPLAEGQQSGLPGSGTARAGRLGELERKAEERDQMVRRCRELEAELASLRDMLSGKSESTADLTNTAASAAVSNAVALAGGEGSSTTVGLGERLRELQETVRSQAERIRGLETNLVAVTASNTLLTATCAGLVAANKRLVAGNYEYYEVRKGDTLETIAARKQVYGAADRSEWLRQANWKRVQDIDNLRPGEVLIVPRYPPGADFDY